MRYEMTNGWPRVDFCKTCTTGRRRRTKLHASFGWAAGFGFFGMREHYWLKVGGRLYQVVFSTCLEERGIVAEAEASKKQSKQGEKQIALSLI